MTTEQVRDLLHHLLARRQVYGQPRRDPTPAHYIDAVAPVGDGELLIIFKGGAVARVNITMDGAS